MFDHELDLRATSRSAHLESGLDGRFRARHVQKGHRRADARRSSIVRMFSVIDCAMATKCHLCLDPFQRRQVSGLSGCHHGEAERRWSRRNEMERVGTDSERFFGGTLERCKPASYLCLPFLVFDGFSTRSRGGGRH